MVTIRDVRLPEDRDQIRAIDRSFHTDRIYRIVRTAWSFTLEDVPADPPVRKDWPLGETDFGEERPWEHGLVAEQAGTIIGFLALSHRRWNRRTEVQHLYVARPLRGRGVGRALVEAAITAAQVAGMRCIWLETSTLAYPAIHFYRRLGFALCGLDASLYDPQGMLQEETALYFACSLVAGEPAEAPAMKGR